jgi:hypothetical protein
MDHKEKTLSIRLSRLITELEERVGCGDENVGQKRGFRDTRDTLTHHVVPVLTPTRPPQVLSRVLSRVLLRVGQCHTVYRDV